MMIICAYSLANSLKGTVRLENSIDHNSETALVCQDCAKVKPSKSAGDGKCYVSCSTQCDPIFDEYDKHDRLNSFPSPRQKLAEPLPLSPKIVSQVNVMDDYYKTDRGKIMSGPQSPNDGNRQDHERAETLRTLDMIASSPKHSKLEDRLNDSPEKDSRNAIIPPNVKNTETTPNINLVEYTKEDATTHALPQRIKIVKQGANIKGVLKLPPIAK